MAIGIAGATIRAKNGSVVRGSKLYLGDSLLSIADEYGQYFYQIQAGTYPLISLCTGYQSIDAIMCFVPGTKHYVNLE